MNARDSLGGTGMRRRCTTLAAAIAAVIVLSGCETMGDVGSALDPTDWFEGEPPRPQTQAQADMRDRTEAEAAQARAQRTPDVTTVPQRPPVSTPAGTRARVAEGLVADRDQARYTDDAIRLQNIPVAGQPAPQQAAAPPPPAPPQTTARTAPPAPPPPPVTAAAPPPPPPAPAPAPAVRSAPMPPAPMAQPAPQPSPQVAAVPPRPAAPIPQLPGRNIEGQPVVSPGDPGARQAAAAQPMAPVAPARAAPPPAPMVAPAGAQQQMAALPQLNVRPSAGRTAARATPAGPHQVAVIQFADNSAKLDSNDRKVLRQVAELQRQTGSSVRIVGHASSRTRQVVDDRHQQANLAMSQRRATAVAQALFEMGVTAQVVQIEAAADSQPLFSEAMPTGEAGNRRAEIYFLR